MKDNDRKGEPSSVQTGRMRRHGWMKASAWLRAGRVVWRAALWPADKHEAVRSWSASGRRHPENESSENCRGEELSLFPPGVRSGNFLCRTTVEPLKHARTRKKGKAVHTSGGSWVTLRRSLFRTCWSNGNNQRSDMMDGAWWIVVCCYWFYFCRDGSELTELWFSALCFLSISLHLTTPAGEFGPAVEPGEQK